MRSGRWVSTDTLEMSIQTVAAATAVACGHRTAWRRSFQPIHSKSEDEVGPLYQMNPVYP
jgi:hypothetical protein